MLPSVNKEVLGNCRWLNQKTVVTQGIRLSSHICEKLFNAPTEYTTKLMQFVETAVKKGIYDSTWLAEAIAHFATS